jgi:uncharacterized protein YaaW (UPF0174 family)
MAYEPDEELEFLKECSSDELAVLVEILTKDQDRKPRWAEEMSTDPRYKDSYPDHRLYWELIAGEIQAFGGNTIPNLLRGHGVPYREVLSDVCDRCKVNYNPKSAVELIEMNLLMKVLTESAEKMTAEQLQDFVAVLELKTTNFTSQAVIAALQAAIALGGFAPYRVAMIVANAVAKTLVGRGLGLAANAGLARAIGVVAGPIGWTVSALWLAKDIAGPAYRVTIPAVIHVAFLRAKRQHGQT